MITEADWMEGAAKSMEPKGNFPLKLQTKYSNWTIVWKNHDIEGILWILSSIPHHNTHIHCINCPISEHYEGQSVSPISEDDAILRQIFNEKMDFEWNITMQYTNKKKLA